MGAGKVSEPLWERGRPARMRTGCPRSKAEFSFITRFQGKGDATLYKQGGRNDPYGFIGKYQAVEGMGKDRRALASELYDILMLSPTIGPKITSAQVKLLSESLTFDESRRIIHLIEKSAYLTTKHVASMQESIEKNGQVSSSWVVPEKIHAIAKKVTG